MIKKVILNCFVFSKPRNDDKYIIRRIYKNSVD